MPTPPVYTNAFRVVGSGAETPLISGGQPSWGYFRSPVTFTGSYRYNPPAGTSSDYDLAGVTLATSTNGENMFRCWQPFHLQAQFNLQLIDGGFTFGPYSFGDPDNYDYTSVDQDDFNFGVVGGSVTAYDTPSSSYVTFTIVAESGNYNGVAHYPVADSLTTAIVLPLHPPPPPCYQSGQH